MNEQVVFVFLIYSAQLHCYSWGEYAELELGSLN